MTTETQPTLDGFIDDAPEAPAGPAPIIVGRSELERFVECPHQAVMIDRGMVTNSNVLTDVGNEVHRVISEAVAIRAGDGIRPNDMREFIEQQAMCSRPDIQPQVLVALRRAYPVVGLICYQTGSGNERAPDDLLRFDGGDGPRAGQLAHDLVQATEDRGPVRITGELDLLMATPSAEELDVVDWKSGWRWWTATEVEDSFQFQFYAALVMLNYPMVRRVRVRVYMTAYGEITGAVEFTRERHLLPILERIKTAIGVYLKWHDTPDIADVPAWPQPPRCALCPAARLCIHVHKPVARLADGEGAFFDQMVAMEAALDQMTDQASVAVRKRGEDFQFAGGGYGTDAPKATRAEKCKLYAFKKS